MAVRKGRHSHCLFIEVLEDRYNLSPTLIANVPLIQHSSVWDYSIGPISASPVMADLDGDGQQEVLAPGGDGNLYAYKYNKANGQVAEEREFFCGTFAGQIQSTPVVANYAGGLVVFAAN